jgi:hypothetical protein
LGRWGDGEVTGYISELNSFQLNSLQLIQHGKRLNSQVEEIKKIG